MMKKQENEYENSGLSIDDAVSQFWCRVIEGIVHDSVQKAIRSMQVEQYAEVEITEGDAASNTVTCRNIQTGEEFGNVPNHSNFDLNLLRDDKGKIPTFKARGRMFITSIKDNPYYLGVWYN